MCAEPAPPPRPPGAVPRPAPGCSRVLAAAKGCAIRLRVRRPRGRVFVSGSVARSVEAGSRAESVLVLGAPARPSPTARAPVRSPRQCATAPAPVSPPASAPGVGAPGFGGSRRTGRCLVGCAMNAPFPADRALSAFSFAYPLTAHLLGRGVCLDLFPFFNCFCCCLLLVAFEEFF